jgi:hypothetical protein
MPNWPLFTVHRTAQPAGSWPACFTASGPFRGPRDQSTTSGRELSVGRRERQRALGRDCVSASPQLQACGVLSGCAVWPSSGRHLTQRSAYADGSSSAQVSISSVFFPVVEKRNGAPWSMSARGRRESTGHSLCGLPCCWVAAFNIAISTWPRTSFKGCLSSTQMLIRRPLVLIVRLRAFPSQIPNP